MDAFEENIAGVQNLIESDINKVNNNSTEEVGEIVDALELKMSDEELIRLSETWTGMDAGYSPNLVPRQKQNKKYYQGAEWVSGIQSTKVVASNLIFESKETFIPQALAKNPEPMVWSDNTQEGKEASNQIKAMLQFKADTMGLRKKLGITLRLWDIYFLGVIKHGWDKKAKDFKSEVRNAKNFIFDPNGYIDESGRYIGEFLGEKCPTTVKKLIEDYPKHKDEILLKVDGKLGTKATYTEWWTDEYCFYTFQGIVLDKHKNEFFNYDKVEKNTEEEQERYGLDEPETVTPGKNHFAYPIMPYSFFSVFTLQEQPHDITSLTEQSVPNQDRIIERDLQITRNLRTGNNSIALSGLAFDMETGRQAAKALEDGDPVLVPNGDIDNGIKRVPASPLPNGIIQSQEIDKDTLRGIYGTKGLVPDQKESQTARGQILNNDQDSSRIGGGIGESLEQLADNIFNWWLQLMYVYYDEPHYAAIVGKGSAVTFVQIVNSDINRQFVVSVAPNSMKPKDEISEINQAISLWEAKALDPLSLFKILNYPDPQETAKQVTMWITNPALYMQTYFPEQAQQAQQQGLPQGQIPLQEGQQSGSLSQTPEAQGKLLSQVPIKV